MRLSQHVQTFASEGQKWAVRPANIRSNMIKSIYIKRIL